MDRIPNEEDLYCMICGKQTVKLHDKHLYDATDGSHIVMFKYTCKNCGHKIGGLVY